VAVRKLVLSGNPKLRKPCETITNFRDPTLSQLYTDMLDSMKAYKGIGLAAPQIGVNKRVIVYGYEDSDRYPGAPAIDLTYVINPEIIKYSDESNEVYEGCLSLPGVRGNTPRPIQVTLKGFDRAGDAFERDVTGFEARVVQHEVDHFNGILYPERMTDLATLVIQSEFEKFGSLRVK
jgi:peptide deformylase